MDLSGPRCHISYMSTGILLNSDDTIQLTPSVTDLVRKDVTYVNGSTLDVQLNRGKSVDKRIIQRFNCVILYEVLVTNSKEYRNVGYLGVFMVSVAKFKGDISSATCFVYRVFGTICGRIGRAASAALIVFLLKSIRLPIRYFETRQISLLIKLVSSPNLLTK